MYDSAAVDAKNVALLLKFRALQSLSTQDHGIPFESTSYRRRVCEGALKTFHYELHPWQVDATEALHLGIHTGITAGTSSGKTTPFITEHVMTNADKGLISVILSPLNALQAEQAAKFRKMGLVVEVVNGKTYNKQVQKVRGLLKESIV